MYIRNNGCPHINVFRTHWKLKACLDCGEWLDKYSIENDIVVRRRKNE